MRFLLLKSKFTTLLTKVRHTCPSHWIESKVDRSFQIMSGVSGALTLLRGCTVIQDGEINNFQLFSLFSLPSLPSLLNVALKLTYYLRYIVGCCKCKGNLLRGLRWNLMHLSIKPHFMVRAVQG